ncbi:MAG: glycosyl hydrolase [Mucilaginibacter sp.]|nr:glycosyl hydrolase [Mucilaginibacter sp.]
MKEIRPIAIHLPQFHPFPENDEWWGKGFTEWTNVTKAKPLFKGHYQPHLPTDLGFYDLRLEQTRIDQAELARENGIYGFCYYHYWFDGKRLMDQPLDALLESKKPDFPFMFCWANEDWSRRWEGSEHLILIKQSYSKLDAENHCRCLIPFFLDERYIKVGNKPVFCFYKPQLIPNIKEYVTLFRKEAQKHGIELYLCFMENQEMFVGDDFEAAIEFQPWSKDLINFTTKVEKESFLGNFNNRYFWKAFEKLKLEKTYKELRHKVIYRIEYDEYVDYLLQRYKYPQNYKRYPGVTPMWDNTARLGKNSFLFKNSTPEKYGEWLRFHKNNFNPYSKDENFVFINAWNEWAEGNHLEPCIKWGKSYLDVTQSILKND